MLLRGLRRARASSIYDSHRIHKKFSLEGIASQPAKRKSRENAVALRRKDQHRMRLIGMLDSPYVRRVAISMQLMGIPFSHAPLSVFRQFDAFGKINPVVKAPTLETDDGIVLMDSSLMLEYLERTIPAARRLTPEPLDAFARAQRIIGLALAACDKTVQIVYEFNLRPREKQHQPWIERVHGQLLAAYRLLESEVGSGKSWLFGARPLQGDITAAVAWRFTQSVLADMVRAPDYPALVALSARAEALPEFLSSPID
jgi:glutathione S-transferase